MVDAFWLYFTMIFSSLQCSIHVRHLSWNLYSLSKKEKKPMKKQKQFTQIHQNRKPKLPFPKTSLPMPLQLQSDHQSSYPRKKIEALEDVINKIQTSMENGIYINDPHIFAVVLESCFKLKAYDLVLRIHNLIPGRILSKNVGISSKLIKLYASNGHLEIAHQLFDQMPKGNASPFPWNSLIGGYVDKGFYEDALALYFQMVEEGVEPDQHTFPRVLKACGCIGIFRVGEEVHRHVIRYGYGDDVFVLNALVDMYSKCGDIAKARKIFGRIMNKDLVSWNSILVGCIRHGLIAEAVSILYRMVHEGHLPDSVTLSSVLTSLPSVRLGTQIHGWIIRHGVEVHTSVTNSLIYFYSSCGKLDLVQYLFNNMPENDRVSWNSIISAHSKDKKALEYYQQMVNANVFPDGITFVSLLSACAHLGMVEEGEKLFSTMRDKYKIYPLMEHYACMVNLYGRAGLTGQAYDLITLKMDFFAGPTVWGALLYGCYLHGNVDIGEIAAKTLFELEPGNELNYELLMKIYQKVNRLADAQRIKEMMIERGMDFF